MIDFFTSNPTHIQFGSKAYPMFEYIRKMYRLSVDNLVSYYNSRNSAVRNDHLLSRIVELGAPSLKLEKGEYFKHANVTAQYTAKHFKLVNNISVGEIKHDIFYNKNSIELIMHSEFDYTLQSVVDNYTNHFPLRVVYTEETALDFHLLNGKKEKDKPTLTVFELDISLMLLMYRGWALRRLKFGCGTDSNMFIANVVIPNAIKTMVDHIIFNRFIKVFKKEPIPEFKLKHPIYVYDLTRGLDVVLGKAVTFLTKRNIDMYEMITNIPTIYYKNMFKALRINRSIYNRQSEWAIWLSRLKYIEVLIELLGPRGIARNTSLLYMLPYEIKRLKNRSTPLYQQLSKEPAIEQEYIECIDRIHSKIMKK